MNRTRILLADDHVMLLDTLGSVLEPEFDVIGVVRDGHALVERATRDPAEIVVADVEMPNLNGIEALRVLQTAVNSPKVIFLSIHSDRCVVEQALKAGASGYVLKAGLLDELVKAIRCVSRGGKYVTPLLGDLISALVTGDKKGSRDSALTERQRAVLEFLAAGKTMNEIGHLLKTSPRTVESHKYEIMRKFGLRTTAELIRYAVRNRLVSNSGLPTTSDT